MAMEVGVEVAEEGAAVVVPRACRRHPSMDAEDVVDSVASQCRHLLCLLPLPLDS
jgi:hypothetical protein